MRDHAHRTVRSRRRLPRQGLVHVYGLHEAEAHHHQHKEHGRAFTEQRAFELANDLHTGRATGTIPKLEVQVEATEAGIATFSRLKTFHFSSLIGIGHGFVDLWFSVKMLQDSVGLRTADDRRQSRSVGLLHRLQAAKMLQQAACGLRTDAWHLQ
jgi:hypothetical protein